MHGYVFQLHSFFYKSYHWYKQFLHHLSQREEFFFLIFLFLAFGNVDHMFCTLSATETDEELVLKRALEMSMMPSDEVPAGQVSATPSQDFSSMSEEDQIAYAMQMSLQGAGTLLRCCYLIFCLFLWLCFCHSYCHLLYWFCVNTFLFSCFCVNFIIITYNCFVFLCHYNKSIRVWETDAAADGDGWW